VRLVAEADADVPPGTVAADDTTLSPMAWLAPGRGSQRLMVLPLPWAGTVTTSLRAYRRNWPELAWSKHGHQARFQSARPAQAGDHWTLRWAAPHRVTQVTIATGSERHPSMAAPDGSLLQVWVEGDPAPRTASVRHGHATVHLAVGGEHAHKVQLLVGPATRPACLLVAGLDVRVPPA
jgi:hypothetical protein